MLAIREGTPLPSGLHCADSQADNFFYCRLFWTPQRNWMSVTQHMHYSSNADVYIKSHPENASTSSA